MSNHFSKYLIVSLQRRWKVIGVVGCECVLLIILAPVITYLVQHLNFSPFVTYLGDIRVTPAWPQIGLLSTPIHRRQMVDPAIRKTNEMSCV